MQANLLSVSFHQRTLSIFRFVLFVFEVITYSKSYDNCGDQDGVSKKSEPTPPDLIRCTVFAFQIWNKDKEN